MKKMLSAVLLLAVLLSLSACGGVTECVSGSGEINIVTTCFPAFDFAHQIVGERGQVTLLVPPGTELHSYEPTPGDILRISECDLLISNGGESEVWLQEILEGSDRNIPNVVMLECVQPYEEAIKEGMQHVHEEHEHDEHEDHDEHDEENEEEEPEYDEHVWTSPTNAALISTEICYALCNLDTDGTEYYKANLSTYTAELYELRDEFRKVVDNSRLKTVIFADRFPVRYFVEEFGLDYFAAFPGCAGDVEPSAKTVAFLIDKVRAENVPVVFFIEMSNEKMADIICEDTGCKKLLFHSCQTVGIEEFKAGANYLDLMYSNLDSLKEALD